MSADKNINILVVDDTDQTRDALVRGLAEHGYVNVISVKTGNEAVAKVLELPEWADVVVIDHVLDEGSLDGIQTTKKICESSLKEVYPIVFTNVPADDRETVKAFEAAAYKAGAYRYLYRARGHDVRGVTDFVVEIKQLRQLKEKVRTLYESQQNFPSLLPYLDIVVSLFDKNFKVWYRNPTAERYQRVCLPCHECPAAPMTCGFGSPCRGCLVAETFKLGRRQEKIILRPIGHSKGLKYFHVITTPITDETSTGMTADLPPIDLPPIPRQPIAVMQFLDDLTDSDRLRALDMRERLKILAQSLFEIPQGFDRVRVYLKQERGETLILAATVGYDRSHEGNTVELKDFETFAASITHLQQTGVGKFWHKPGYKDHLRPTDLKEKFIQWPIMRGGRLLGLISVSCVPKGRVCNEDKLPIVGEFAEEALKIIESDEADGPGAAKLLAEVDNLVADVDNSLVLQREPGQLIEKLIQYTYDLTESDMVHIRYRSDDGRFGILFPYGKGNYVNVAPKRLGLSDSSIPSLRVIRSGVMEIEHHAKSARVFVESLLTLPEEAQKILSDVESYLILPLKHDGHTIGSLALYKSRVEHYDQRRLLIATSLASRLAPALSDFLLYTERNKELLEKLDLQTREDLLKRVVHNLRQPTAAAHLFISTLKRDFEQLPPKAQELIDNTESSIIHIEALINTYLDYGKPILLRIRNVSLREVLSDPLLRFKKYHPTVSTSLTVKGRDDRISVDANGLEWIVEEMLQNAFKMGARRVDISAVFSDEEVEISFEDDGSAVPENLRDGLFDRFKTSHPLGTGLGLSNIKKIVEEHHGSVRYDPSYQGGARFIVVLPRVFSKDE